MSFPASMMPREKNMQHRRKKNFPPVLPDSVLFSLFQSPSTSKKTEGDF